MMIVKKISVDEFDDSLLSRFIGNSFFASKQFLKLWEETDGRGYYITVLVNDQPVALIPIVEFGKGKLCRTQSMPEGLYTKIYHDRSFDDFDQIFEVINQFLIKENYAKVFIYDYFNQIQKFESFDVLECQTSLIDISSPDWQPPDKKIQSEIRKAEKEGTTVEKFNKDKHLDKFLTLMKETERRHKKKQRYPDIFFEKLAILSEEDDRVVWNYCEHDGTPVASHINFIENDTMLNWQIYFDKQFSFLKPNQKIIYDNIKKYSQQGIKYFNLGASPGDADNLKSYKAKWGGVDYRYRCYQKKSLLGKVL